MKWHQTIAASGLPDAAQQMIVQVVKRTRLWRSERADVAMELIAHFADGLDAGHSIDQLVNDFGDPRKAAMLIRRAKKRNRSWLWQSMRRFGQFVGVVMVIYIGMWAWLMMSSPKPSVDYVAKLNTAADAVRQADRAWPIYRKAWIEGKIWDLKFDEVMNADNQLVQPGEAGWEKVAGFLAEHAVLVEAARRGGAMPGLGLNAGFSRDYTGDDRLALYGPDTDQSERQARKGSPSSLLDGAVIGMLLPNLGHMRNVSQLLKLDMQLAATQGDGERIVADYRALLGLARQAREVPTLVNQLVAIGIANQADLSLVGLLDRNVTALTAEQLAELAHLTARVSALCRIDLDGEQAFLDDFIQRLYSDDGHGDGHVTYQGVRMFAGGDIPGASDKGVMASAGLPLAYLMMASRREMQEQADHLYDMSQKYADQPLWKQLREEPQAVRTVREMKASFASRTKFWMLMILMPGLERAGVVGQQAVAVNEALQVAIGLELYRREHGRYPQTLEELAPRYVPTMPIDYSTGKPLLYVLRDRGSEAAAEKEAKPVLYGRGLDGDDDGGVWDAKEKVRWPNVPKQGDWVLWPVPGQ